MAKKNIFFSESKVKLFQKGIRLFSFPSDNKFFQSDNFRSELIWLNKILFFSESKVKLFQKGIRLFSFPSDNKFFFIYSNIPKAT
jgi:hypothetical protein